MRLRWPTDPLFGMRVESAVVVTLTDAAFEVGVVESAASRSCPGDREEILFDLTLLFALIRSC